MSLVASLAMRRIVFAVLVCLGPGLCSCSEEEAGSKIPATLAELEGVAEDAYDLALLGKTSAVQTDAKQLVSLWKKFQDDAKQQGVGSKDLVQLGDAITALDDGSGTAGSDVNLARLANAVSRRMSAFYAAFDAEAVTELLDLDYLGREVALDGLDGVVMDAIADVDEIEALWSQIRARTVAAGGKQQAADFDASVTALRMAIAAKDAPMLVKRANAELDLVDEIEQVFDKANAADPAD